MHPPIRVGIGGWTYEPWRGTFFPDGLPRARELGYASRHVTAIEVNGTFYRTQTPDTFEKWAQESADEIVFALKAPRYAVNKRVLGEAEPAIAKFMTSGLERLGPKLGPILWQLAPTKRFDPDDLAAFLALLPADLGGRPLHHVLEVRHESFLTADFVALMRDRRMAVAYADSDEHPALADVTGPIVYARLQRAREEEPTGYGAEEIARWAERARIWAAGGVPEDLPQVDSATRPEARARPTFIFMINGAKVRAPHAAMALIERLKA